MRFDRDRPLSGKFLSHAVQERKLAGNEILLHGRLSVDGTIITGGLDSDGTMGLSTSKNDNGLTITYCREDHNDGTNEGTNLSTTVSMMN